MLPNICGNCEVRYAVQVIRAAYNEPEGIVSNRHIIGIDFVDTGVFPVPPFNRQGVWELLLHGIGADSSEWPMNITVQNELLKMWFIHSKNFH